MTSSPSGRKRALGMPLKLLADHRIGAIVVVDETRSVEGIVSEAGNGAPAGRARRGRAGRKLGNVATRAVVTCTTDETIPVIMERMTRGRFRHVPVVAGDKLLGIISIGDVVKFRVEEDGARERPVARLHHVGLTAAAALARAGAGNIRCSVPGGGRGRAEKGEGGCAPPPNCFQVPAAARRRGRRSVGPQARAGAPREGKASPWSSRPGNLAFAASSEREGTMMTSSPCFQSTGIIFRCCAVSCRLSTTRRM